MKSDFNVSSSFYTDKTKLMLLFLMLWRPLVDVGTVAPPPAVDGSPVCDVEDQEEDREHTEEHQVSLGEPKQSTVELCLCLNHPQHTFYMEVENSNDEKIDNRCWEL